MRFVVHTNETGSEILLESDAEYVRGLRDGFPPEESWHGPYEALEARAKAMTDGNGVYSTGMFEARLVRELFYED